MLNQLLAAAGPAVFARMMAGQGPSLAVPSGVVTPEMANRVTPEAVEVIATETHKQNPSIVIPLAGFMLSIRH